MTDSVVRIESVEIKNFKNVKYGSLKFENPNKDFKPSILGLYGQNGSGKTALIDAISLLHLVLSGQRVPTQFSDFINVDADHATLKFEFKVDNQQEHLFYSVFYEFSIRKDPDDSLTNTNNNNSINNYKTTVFNEVLSYSYESISEKAKLSPIVDTNTSEVFIPQTKYDQLIGKSKEDHTNLIVAKKYASSTSRSFVFSKELFETINKNCELEYHRYLFERLIYFGNYELFVINTTNIGLISLNALPLAFNYEENHHLSIGSLTINLNEPSLIPEDAVTLVEKIIACMNVVLVKLVPGLTISIKKLGNQLYPNGTTATQLQLMSNKNSKEIPLKYESDGIKKIISILQLLIVIYNKASLTVAIDELDSGIFEYLLGEILKIISENGKGQLIFTSHNLRPLETLDKGFIAFTTTNENQRYLRMTNVKTTNNLRDFYYRDIILGQQNEPIYDHTNNSDIALAFRKAGKNDE